MVIGSSSMGNPRMTLRGCTLRGNHVSRVLVLAGRVHRRAARCQKEAIAPMLLPQPSPLLTSVPSAAQLCPPSCRAPLPQTPGLHISAALR
ncbi:hypothetical protein CALCODRAFT_202495 [Calocera cornea HHB12733]|uniref:Uncharacterized protein n=1 Tax=Calocera cornea HHB12733 TaxID=1353952 RepID=A0A165JY69_9BASI|nr:hypothetical protein CALCODRAFT_202495 [Calocera cornea HHB12733]